MAPPLSGETPLNKLVPTRINSDTYEDLLLIVQYQGSTQAQVVRKAIQLYLEQELATLRPTIRSLNAC
jgi:hypothetical protein